MLSLLLPINLTQSRFGVGELTDMREDRDDLFQDPGFVVFILDVLS